MMARCVQEIIHLGSIEMEKRTSYYKLLAPNRMEFEKKHSKLKLMCIQSTPLPTGSQQ